MWILVTTTNMDDLTKINMDVALHESEWVARVEADRKVEELTDPDTFDVLQDALMEKGFDMIGYGEFENTKRTQMLTEEWEIRIYKSAGELG